METLIILIILILGWDLAWYLAGVKPLFPWQLKKMLDKGQNPGRLIDVRTQPEFNWFHIDGAENRPDVLFDIDRYKDKNFDEPVVVICMSGHRSPIVAYRLKKHGYKQVYNLTWGMLGWKLFGMKKDE
jgi:rhodanese-related sulfurtransferase